MPLFYRSVVVFVGRLKPSIHSLSWLILISLQWALRVGGLRSLLDDDIKAELPSEEGLEADAEDSDGDEHVDWFVGECGDGDDGEILIRRSKVSSGTASGPGDAPGLDRPRDGT